VISREAQLRPAASNSCGGHPNRCFAVSPRWGLGGPCLTGQQAVRQELAIWRGRLEGSSEGDPSQRDRMPAVTCRQVAAAADCDEDAGRSRQGVQDAALRQPVSVPPDSGDRLKRCSAGLALFEVGPGLGAGVVGHVQQAAGLPADDELAGWRPSVDASGLADGSAELGRDLLAGEQTTRVWAPAGVPVADDGRGRWTRRRGHRMGGIGAGSKGQGSQANHQPTPIPPAPSSWVHGTSSAASAQRSTNSA
jgi:hypothetical protein